MTVLRRQGDCSRQERNDGAPLPKDKLIRQKLLFGSFADSDMVAWLRGLALDPCKSGASHDLNRRLCDQIINVRKVMLLTNTEFPRRKRKLQQFLNGKFRATTGSGKFRATAGLSTEKHTQQKCIKLNRGKFSVASSASCLQNLADSYESFNQHIFLSSRDSGSLLTFEDNFKGKHVSNDVSFVDNAIDFGPNIKYSSSFFDSDESVNGSNSPCSVYLALQDLSLPDADDTVHSSNSVNVKNVKKLKQLTMQRLPIPLGPRFQAEVPEWTGPVRGDDGSENSRWLGTRIWPIKGGSRKSSMKAIGKGRPDSCSCVYPGSADCIHVLKERIRLQSDLGPAFSSWKFDEMGEFVLNSWTLKEQKTFESLVKMNMLKNGTNFWKHALKCFPTKSKRSIINLYFNVFIPRRIRLQIRSSLKQIDSEDEEVEDVDYMDFRKGCKSTSDSVGNTKDTRTRYLRQGS